MSSFAGAVAYGLVVWSFLVEVVGAGVGASQWLLDTSVLHHIARAPASQVRWDSLAVLAVIGTIAAPSHVAVRSSGSRGA